jgi:hypothetical protein
MNIKSLLVIGVIAIVAVAIALRVPMIRGLVFGSAPAA